MRDVQDVQPVLEVPNRNNGPDGSPREVPEEPLREAKSELPAWANFPLLITGTAVFAFLLSCLFVDSITRALHFPVAVYMDFADYLKLIPTALTIAAGYWGPVLFIMSVIALYKFLLRPYYHLLVRNADPSRALTRRVISFAQANRSFFALCRLFVLFAPIYLVLQLLWAIYLYGGEQTIEGLRNAPIINVFRKGELAPVQGKLFALSSRYVMLLTKHDTSITLVPQTEVQLI